MCDRIKTINRHYNALEYEINRQEALKKISTLRDELIFKDNNNFSDRFLQTASLIEKNLSIFKSACDHVDIVTTLVEHLYCIGTKLMFAELNMISIWSEDITSAKALAIMLQKDIIFINSHLEFGSDIILPYTALRSVFDLIHIYDVIQFEDGEIINPDTCTGSIYNFFYDGTCQYPVKNTYWMYNDNIYAQATKEDIDKCVVSATEAFKIWSNLPIISRIKILRKLVSTLECNGKFLLAKTVSKWIKLGSKMFENTLICQDERLESVIVHAPKDIVSLYHEDEVVLFSYLTLSLIVGNCVVVLCNQFSCNLAPYCNIFAASEIPPGVLNLLSNRNMFNRFKCPNYTSKDLICASTKSKNILLPLK